MESLKLLNTIKNRLFFLPAIFIYFFWSSGHIFHTLTARPIEIFWIDSLRRIWWCWSSGGSTGSFIRMSLQCFSCLLSPPFKVSITGKIRPKSIAAIWSHWSHSGLRVVILVVVVVVISWTTWEAKWSQWEPWSKINPSGRIVAVVIIIHIIHASWYSSCSWISSNGYNCYEQE